jgi:hypothetical protein
VERRNRSGPRLLALFALGWLLLTYPMLHLLKQSGWFLGVPTLYAYLFLVWIGFIAVLAALVR